jgi:hypothetical protein
MNELTSLLFIMTTLAIITIWRHVDIRGICVIGHCPIGLLKRVRMSKLRRQWSVNIFNTETNDIHALTSLLEQIRLLLKSASVTWISRVPLGSDTLHELTSVCSCSKPGARWLSSRWSSWICVLVPVPGHLRAAGSRQAAEESTKRRRLANSGRG